MRAEPAGVPIHIGSRVPYSVGKSVIGRPPTGGGVKHFYFIPNYQLLAIRNRVSAPKIKGFFAIFEKSLDNLKDFPAFFANYQLRAIRNPLFGAGPPSGGLNNPPIPPIPGTLGNDGLSTPLKKE